MIKITYDEALELQLKKKCRTCEVDFTVDKLVKHKSGKYGVGTHCKPCHSKSITKYKANKAADEGKEFTPRVKRILVSVADEIHVLRDYYNTKDEVVHHYINELDRINSLIVDNKPLKFVSRRRDIIKTFPFLK